MSPSCWSCPQGLFLYPGVLYISCKRKHSEFSQVPQRNALEHSILLRSSVMKSCLFCEKRGPIARLLVCRPPSFIAWLPEGLDLTLTLRGRRKSGLKLVLG
ncbi:hypothetical protein ACQKWADRAFT_135999 [Trichoderma austrokoningii]